MVELHSVSLFSVGRQSGYRLTARPGDEVIAGESRVLTHGNHLVAGPRQRVRYAESRYDAGHSSVEQNALGHVYETTPGRTTHYREVLSEPALQEVREIFGLRVPVWTQAARLTAGLPVPVGYILPVLRQDRIEDSFELWEGMVGWFVNDGLSRLAAVRKVLEAEHS